MKSATNLDMFVWIVRTLIIVSIFVTTVNACSCMPRHPQGHYCSSDFVALVKVENKGKIDGTRMSYHIKVKKEFKMGERAREALSHGLVWTSNLDSMCGVTLKQTKYLLAGKLVGEKPWISLCNLNLEWSKVTNKQRKGFRRLYEQGCHHCKITSFRQTSKTPHCQWDTFQFHSKYDCQRLHSFCAPSPQHPNQCAWVKNKAYRHCMKERKAIRDREP